MIPKFALAAAVVATFLVPGCAAPNQATYSCTPEVGGEPYACVKEQYDLMVERDKLYTEAETVYRKYLVEDYRIYHLGGTEAPTPVMLETLTGEALKSALANYRRLIADSSIAVGGEFRIGHLRRVPDAVREGSIVTWESCVDSTTVTFKDGASSSAGGFGLERAYFSKTNTGLKISQFESKDVDSCG